MGNRISSRVLRKYKCKFFPFLVSIVFISIFMVQFSFVNNINVSDYKQNITKPQKNNLGSHMLKSMAKVSTTSMDITFKGNLFNYNSKYFRGLEYFGNTVYIADYMQHKIYQFSESGKLLLTINKTNPSQFFPHGLDIESDYIYTSDYIGNTIFTYDHNGTLINSTYLDPGNTVGGITALSVINNTFWVARYDSNKIYNYSFNGTLLSSFIINDFIPTGLSKAGNLLFISFVSNSNNIYVYQTNGSYLGFIPLPTSALEEGVYKNGPGDYIIVSGSWNISPYTISKYEVQVFNNQFVKSTSTSKISINYIGPTNNKLPSNSQLPSTNSNNVTYFIIVILIVAGLISLITIVIQKNQQKYISGHKYRSHTKKKLIENQHSPSKNGYSGPVLSDKTMSKLEDMIEETSEE